jgi:hypothetical protein
MSTSVNIDDSFIFSDLPDVGKSCLLAEGIVCLLSD